MRRYLLIIVPIVLLIVVAPVSAVNFSGITIQPLRQELSLNPGQTITNTLQVTNNTKKSQQVVVSAEPFDVINENYDYSFSRSEIISQWVNFKENTAAINPGSSHIFTYSIAIPYNAEPGERYIAIFAAINQNQGDVNITNRAGQLSYITINGNVTKQGEVLNLDLPKFSSKNNLAWQARLQNSGTAHFESLFTTNVFNIFGKNLSQTTQRHLLLPNKIRQINSQVNVGNWPGIYRVQFKIGRGDQPAQYLTKWVVYLPFWSIVVLLVAAGFLVNYFIKRRRAKSLGLRHRRIHYRR